MPKSSAKKATAKVPEKTALRIETMDTPKSGTVPCRLIFEGDPVEISHPVKSIKLIDGAVRWKCVINGQEFEIFNENDDWWMMQ